MHCLVFVQPTWGRSCVILQVVLFSPEIALIVFTQPWLSSFMGCRWVLQPLFRKQWQGVGLSSSSSSFFLWYGLSLLLDEMRFKIVCLSFSCCFLFVGMWGKTLNLCAYVWVCVFFFLRFISWLHCHLAFGLSFPCTWYVYLPCPPQVAPNFS